jgi:hypothetical protein
MRGLSLVLLVVSLQLSFNAQAQRPACPTTTPPGESLGKPFPPSERWYGSETLAVILTPDGIWLGSAKLHYRGKLFWWSYGFEPGSESHLKVSGRRLDGAAPPADVSRPSNAYAPSSWWVGYARCCRVPLDRLLGDFGRVQRAATQLYRRCVGLVADAS